MGQLERVPLRGRWKRGGTPRRSGVTRTFHPEKTWFTRWDPGLAGAGRDSVLRRSLRQSPSFLGGYALALAPDPLGDIRR